MSAKKKMYMYMYMNLNLYTTGKYVNVNMNNDPEYEQKHEHESWRTIQMWNAGENFFLPLLFVFVNAHRVNPASTLRYLGEFGSASHGLVRY